MNKNLEETNNIYKIIGARIQYIRTMNNMSQVELGKKIGFGGTTISNYENAYSEVSVDILHKIADVFGINISYFTDISQDLEPELIQQMLAQKDVVIQFIPYYKISNTNGILLQDKKIADGLVHFPWKSMYSNTIICTDIPDNDMAKLEYKKGEYIFVNTCARPMSGDVALVYDTIEKKMILRKYMTDGPMVTLLAEGYSDVAPIYSDITDPDYKVIGPVVRSTRDY